MNEFLFELKEMKTFDFWHKFLVNECQRKTTRETTEERQTRDERRQQMETTLDLNSRNNIAFSNSAFFDPNTHPTITDQVVMCRQICRQLVCDESNTKSKGREMFEKRVQKSSKWVTTASDDPTDDTSEQSFHETTISDGPPNLRLLLDPRHVQDLNSLDFDSNEREMRDKESEIREKCEEICHDLHSPLTDHLRRNKGNALFAKRQQKSDEWVVKAEQEEEVAAAEQVDSGQVVAKSGDWLPKTYTKTIRFRDFNSKAKPFSRMY